jgi:KTSC domain
MTTKFRMGTVKSELISKLGYDDNTMRVIYAADGAVFDYFGISLSTYKALLRSKSIGADWIDLRDQYKFKRVTP